MSVRIEVQVVPLAEVPKENVDLLSEDRRHLVLVVDDERIIADTLSIILSKNGFSTLTAYDAASALELARAMPPDVLISDVIMPGMTGIELAIALTQMLPECQILLFSGQAAMVDLLEEPRNAGHNFTILTKPVEPTEILRRISECLTMQEACLKLKQNHSSVFIQTDSERHAQGLFAGRTKTDCCVEVRSGTAAAEAAERVG